MFPNNALKSISPGSRIMQAFPNMIQYGLLVDALKHAELRAKNLHGLSMKMYIRRCHMDVMLLALLSRPISFTLTKIAGQHY